MANIYLETDRLRLRELELSETDLLFDLDSDPEVTKYIKGGETTPMEECESAIKKIYAYYEKWDHKFGLWFAEEKQSGEFIGWFLLRPGHETPDDTKNPELGYRFKKKFWGKGYGTEGSKALVDRAFRDFDCDSVFALAMKGNKASQNIMKKVGMSYVGDFAQEACYAPGRDTSCVEHRISRAEWLVRCNL